MLDRDKIRAFWELRSKKKEKLAFESIVNLEENPILLAEKLKLEQQQIIPRLPLNPHCHVLDLGAGVGQWSFRLAPYVKKVTAVEYIASLIEIAEQEAKNRKITNIEFIHAAAETYTIKTPVDIVLISGLFVYLDEVQVKQLMSNLPKLLRQGGILCIRDGTSIMEKSYVINNKYSTTLNEYYSAWYRTREEYLALCQQVGLTLLEDEQMFNEGSLLNKFNETRLWVYLFKKM